MAINLVKGARVEIGLKKVGVGLGWKANESTNGYEYDLDASAFMLGDNNKLPKDEFFVFYNNLVSPDGAVMSAGDDRTGGNGLGGNDDEPITVDLEKVDPAVKEILFTVTIHDAVNRRQNFGQVHNSYIRIYDEENGVEIARYDLEEDFSIETAVEVGSLYRHGNTWRFKAMGEGSRGGLEGLVSKYAY